MSEAPITFPCSGDTLVGILHRPSGPAAAGMVIVVGGPQYRVGSHRLFVSLARDLCARGIAVLRFDCRGMGDSDGEFPGFEKIGPDIEVAVDALRRAVPTVSRLALWALCDGASAVSMYAHQDPRIAGIALVNPWVRTDTSHARAYLRHYYLQRLVHPTFLRKLAAGKVNFWEAGSSLVAAVARSTGSPKGSATNRSGVPLSLPERMASSLGKFRGAILVVTAGRDLTSREFDDVTRDSPAWGKILASGRVRRHDLPESDHTFSQRGWREQVTEWTWEWLAELASRGA